MCLNRGLGCTAMAMRISLYVSEYEYVDLFNVYYTLIIISYRGQTWMEQINNELVSK